MTLIKEECVYRHVKRHKEYEIIIPWKYTGSIIFCHNNYSKSKILMNN